MNNIGTIRAQADKQQTPFSNAPKAKRTVSVAASFDPNLRLPTKEDMKRSTIQANPPIRPTTPQPQIIEFNFDDPVNSAPNPAPKVITNNPDLAVFEDDFAQSNMPADVVEMRVNEQDRIDNSPFSERIALPSNGIFYNFSSIVIRPFKVTELASLYKAKKRQDIILLYDTISKTINVDIRDLWTIDARFIMYWHRMNSFIKTPYRATWESVYGNTNKTKIEMSNIEITPVKMTKERYEHWSSLGYKVPTIRDAEHLDTFRNKLSEEDLWLYERALYIKGTDLHDQKRMIEEDNSVDILYNIRDLINELADGNIVETAKAKDAHFNYSEALKRLAADIEMIDSMLAEDITINSATEELLIARRVVVSKELERLSNTKPGEAEPMLETITLRLGILDFFPDL